MYCLHAFFLIITWKHRHFFDTLKSTFMQKQEIFHQVRTSLENNIEELTRAMDSYNSASDLDESDTRDMEDFSQQDESKEMGRHMQVQLDRAREALVTLDELNGDEITTAKAGALIETSDTYFLLGISFPALHTGDKEVIGVSSVSPAFGELNGKAKGDKFKLGDKSFTIKDVR